MPDGHARACSARRCSSRRTGRARPSGGPRCTSSSTPRRRSRRRRGAHATAPRASPRTPSASRSPSSYTGSTTSPVGRRRAARDSGFGGVIADRSRGPPSSAIARSASSCDERLAVPSLGVRQERDAVALLGPRDDQRRPVGRLGLAVRRRRSPPRRARRPRSRASRTTRRGRRSLARPTAASSGRAAPGGSCPGSRSGCRRRDARRSPSPPRPSPPRLSESPISTHTRARDAVHPHRERHPEPDREALAERAGRDVDPRHVRQRDRVSLDRRTEPPERHQLARRRSRRSPSGPRTSAATRGPSTGRTGRSPGPSDRPRRTAGGPRTARRAGGPRTATTSDAPSPPPSSTGCESTASCAASSFQRSRSSTIFEASSSSYRTGSRRRVPRSRESLSAAALR